LPPHMADLFEREEQYTVLDNDSQVVQQFIADHISA
jgi:threonine synthase